MSPLGEFLIFTFCLFPILVFCECMRNQPGFSLYPCEAVFTPLFAGASVCHYQTFAHWNWFHRNVVAMLNEDTLKLLSAIGALLDQGYVPAVVLRLCYAAYRIQSNHYLLRDGIHRPHVVQLPQSQPRRNRMIMSRQGPSAVTKRVLTTERGLLKRQINRALKQQRGMRPRDPSPIELLQQQIINDVVQSRNRTELMNFMSHTSLLQHTTGINQIRLAEAIKGFDQRHETTTPLPRYQPSIGHNAHILNPPMTTEEEYKKPKSRRINVSQPPQRRSQMTTRSMNQQV